MSGDGLQPDAVSNGSPDQEPVDDTGLHPGGSGLWPKLIVVVVLGGIVVFQIQLYMRMQDLRSSHAAVLQSLASFYLDQQDHARAIPLLKQVTRIEPDNLWAWLALGDAYIVQKQYADSLESFRQALDVEHENARALSGLGWSYLLLGRPEEAIPVLDRAIALSESASNLAALGRAHVALGYCDQALPYLQEALDLQPERQDAIEAQLECE